jgi:hypothetical protein
MNQNSCPLVANIFLFPLQFPLELNEFILIKFKLLMRSLRGMQTWRPDSITQCQQFRHPLWPPAVVEEIDEVEAHRAGRFWL